MGETNFEEIFENLVSLNKKLRDENEQLYRLLSKSLGSELAFKDKLQAKLVKFEENYSLQELTVKKISQNIHSILNSEIKNSDLRERVVSLENKVRELTNQNQILTEKIGFNENTIGSLELELEEMNETVQFLKEEQQKVQSAKEKEFEEKEEKLKKAVEEAKTASEAVVGELEEKLKLSENKNSSLRQLIGEFEKKKSKSDFEKKYKEAIELFRDKFEALESKYEKQMVKLKGKNSALSKTLTEKEKIISKLDLLLSNYERQLRGK